MGGWVGWLAGQPAGRLAGLVSGWTVGWIGSVLGWMILFICNAKAALCFARTPGVGNAALTMSLGTFGVVLFESPFQLGSMGNQNGKTTFILWVTYFDAYLFVY